MVTYGGYVARVFYYPSILLNAAANKVTGGTWYNRINDHLVLGALPMPFMTKYLVNENVKGVVALNEDYELRYLYNTPSAWQRVGMRLLRIATPDLFAAPSVENIKKAIDFISEIKAENGSVYVHCKAGKTRSTTVVICYLMKTEGMDPAEAYAYVKSKRPQAWLMQTQLNCIESFYRDEVLGNEQTDINNNKEEEEERKPAPTNIGGNNETT